ncbi:hypothetical protein FE257_009406 [Aspergillus nanangensis]|uniref:Uncharacterized protein n=1 Tax=Aspergillus nanangensis TaxID=2582783 RepID=A0AAD4CKB1_ASPNN|nr:hypothetical protein FE257_009406 [Aspergillus nanangensis]
MADPAHHLDSYTIPPGGPINPIGPIQCHLCQTTFTRQEHLTRHVRSHRAEKPFHCGQCRKSFTRLDVLHRHSRSHQHSPGTSNGSGSARACKECARGRIRCSRGTPCTRCVQREVRCEYPGPRKRKSLVTGGVPPSDICSPSRSSPQSRSEAVLPVEAPPELGFAEISALNGLSSTPPEGWLVENPLDPFSDWVGNVISVNWLSPQGFHLLPDAQLESLLWPEAVQLDGMQSAGQDYAAAVSEDPLIRPVSDEDGLSTTAHSTSVGTTPTCPPAEGAYYVDGRAGRAPFHGRSSWRARTRTTSSAEAGIPGSGRVQGSKGSLWVSERTYQNCRQCLESRLGLELASITSLHEMQDLVQLYFDGFHPTYPFLRRSPSLFSPDSHWILLLAVAGTGSPYSSQARYHQLGESLVRIVDQVLSMRLDEAVLGGDQPWNPALGSDEQSLDVVTLQATLLNCLCLLQSGRDAAVRHALRRRYRLIEAYHSLNLTVHPNSSQGEPSTDEDWLTVESRIRTGWMIWFLDCITVYQFHCTPLIPLGEANAPLPCPDHLWDSPPETTPQCPAQVAGWEHPTILHLHLARLLLLAPIQHFRCLDVSTFTAPHPALNPSTGSRMTGAATARYHTLHWALRDQYKARLCLVHAGALLWHVRRYSSNSFLEPFGVYAATLTVWAYSMAMQIVPDMPQPDPPTQHPHEETRGNDSSDGDGDGDGDSETEPTVIQLDRPCDDEIVQANRYSQLKSPKTTAKALWSGTKPSGEESGRPCSQRSTAAGFEYMSIGSEGIM